MKIPVKGVSAVASVGSTVAAEIERDYQTPTLSGGEKPAPQLPEPVGYKILIALPEPDDTTEGGLAKAAETLQREEIGSICGFVLAIGPDAFADENKFPGGPYCKVGDWVIMRAYSGTRLSIYGKEFRLINDTSVEAIVDNPRGVLKL